jgi:hypothetical protein
MDKKFHDLVTFVWLSFVSLWEVGSRLVYSQRPFNLDFSVILEDIYSLHYRSTHSPLPESTLYFGYFSTP